MVISCKHLWREREREEEGETRKDRKVEVKGRGWEGGWKRKDIRKDESDTLGMYVVYKQSGETMYKIN